MCIKLPMENHYEREREVGGARVWGFLAGVLMFHLDWERGRGVEENRVELAKN